MHKNRGLGRLGLTARTTLAAGALVLVGLALFELLLKGIDRQQAGANKAARASEVLLALERVRGLTLETQAGTRGYLITREPGFLEPWRDARERTRQANRRLLALVAGEPLSPAPARAIVARIESLIVDWQQPLLALARRDRRAAVARFRTGEAYRRTAEIKRLVAPFAASVQRLRARREREADAATRSATASALAGMGAFLAMLLGAAIYLVVRIGRPVARLAQAARTLGEGSGGVRVRASGRAEIGALARTFNAMADQLERSRAAVEREAERTRAARDELRAIVEASPLAIVARDRAGTITSFNAAAERLYGWPADAVIGRQSPYLDASARAQMQAMHKRALAGETTVKTAVRAHVIDGVRPLLVSMTPARLTGDAVTGTVAFAEDVSEREAALHELALWQARWRAAMRNLPGAALLIFDEDLRYVEAEGDALRALGLDPAQLVGTRAGDALDSAEDRERVERLLGCALAGDPAKAEFEAAGRILRARAVPLELGDGRRGALALSVDITELRRMEAELRDREQRLGTLFANAPIGVGLAEAHEPFRLVEVNPPFAALVGSDRSQLAGLGALSFLDPADTQTARSALARLLDGNAPSVTFETRVVHGDGHAAWASMSVAVVRGPDNEPLHLVVHFQDISERKRFERERERLASATEYGSDAVISIDFDARVHHWGPGAERLYGWSEQEAVGCTLYELTVDTDEPAQQLAAIRAGEPTYTYETRRRRKNGSLVDVQLTITPWLHDGELVGTTGIATDISARKASERQRERILADLEEAQRTARVGSWSCDRHSAAAEWSAQLYELFARDPQRGPPRDDDFCAYVHPADRDRLADAYADLFDGGSSFELEYRIVDRNGAERQLHALAREDPDRPGIYRGTVQDVSELRRTEAKLRRAAARLERSNRELEQFAYVASHDLQEPLRKIGAFGERLELACGHGLDARAADYLQRMRAAAARMSELIAGLLTYSRVRTHPEPFAAVDLSAVVADVLADLETTIEETAARITVDALPVVEGDPVQLRQLFQNLLANALKFRRPDVAPRVAITVVARGPFRVTLDVVDNGIGFDEQYAERVFGMFERLHGRSSYEGSGIGLAVCQRIVERHGGTITAYGKPGRGARFAITLPVHHTNAPAQEHTVDGALA